jgi:hypothetical protein
VCQESEISRHRAAKQTGSPEEGQVIEDGQIVDSPNSTEYVLSSSPQHLQNSGNFNQQNIPEASGDSGQHNLLIHSPLSPSTNDRSDNLGEKSTLVAENEAEDRTKKPRLTFGGGLVCFHNH